MKFNSMSITMGIIFAVMMTIIFFQMIGFVAIPIGLMFGLSMAMAFQEDKDDEKEEEEFDH